MTLGATEGQRDPPCQITIEDGYAQGPAGEHEHYKCTHWTSIVVLVLTWVFGLGHGIATFSAFFLRRRGGGRVFGKEVVEVCLMLCLVRLLFFPWIVLFFLWTVFFFLWTVWLIRTGFGVIRSYIFRFHCRKIRFWRRGVAQKAQMQSPEVAADDLKI